MRLRVALMAAALAACATTPAQSQEPPDWMAGHWLSCEGGQVEETWVGAGSGLLAGTNVTRGERASFEWLRVSAGSAGGLSYWSSPDGRSPPTEFAMVSNDGQRAVFENPQHDFPQRIVYARDGDVLRARIEGPMNGRTEFMEWRFARAELGAVCPLP